jgi:hypothetical protein
MGLNMWSEWAFILAMMMSFLCFAAFLWIAWSEMRQRAREGRGRHYESLPDPGDMAVKFASAGLGPSTLACAVVFMLLAVGIAMAIDQISLLPLITGPGG